MLFNSKVLFVYTVLDPNSLLTLNNNIPFINNNQNIENNENNEKKIENKSKGQKTFYFPFLKKMKKTLLHQIAFFSTSLLR